MKLTGLCIKINFSVKTAGSRETLVNNIIRACEQLFVEKNLQPAN